MEEEILNKTFNSPKTNTGMKNYNNNILDHEGSCQKVKK